MSIVLLKKGSSVSGTSGLTPNLTGMSMQSDLLSQRMTPTTMNATEGSLTEEYIALSKTKTIKETSFFADLMSVIGVNTMSGLIIMTSST